MSESIAVALITGVLALLGSIVSNVTISAKKAREDEMRNTKRETEQAMRLDSIEKKLDIHNGYAEKIGDIRKDIAVVKKEIEYIRKEKKNDN